MKARDILLYMLGHREAIRRVGASRWSLLVGPLLCITAGITRHYDHRIYVEEPWKLLIGAGVALVNATIIYVFMVLLVARQAAPGDRLRAAGRFYLPWLACFWMTAPAGWLYAIPVELWADEVTAMKLNLGLLALVSVWRVALMVRVAQVLGGLRWWRGLAAIGLPASILMAAGLVAKQLSMMKIMMGGVDSPADEAFTALLEPTLFFLLLAAAASLFTLILAALTAPDAPPPAEPAVPQRPGFPVLPVCIAVALIGLGVMATLPAQRQQVAMRDVNALYRPDDPTPMLRELSRHQPEDFGRYLALMPNPYSDWGGGLGLVLANLDERVAPWVRDAYMAQLQALAMDQAYLRYEMGDTSFDAPLDRRRRPNGEVWPVLQYMVQALAGRDWLVQHPETVRTALEAAAPALPGPDGVMHPEWQALLRDLQGLGLDLPPAYLTYLNSPNATPTSPPVPTTPPQESTP